MKPRLIAALMLGVPTVTLGPVACQQAPTQTAAAPTAGTEAGIQPSWMACRVIENAPVMIDWLAMMVATVHRMIRGKVSHGGHRR